ncbi:MAG TPA: hypothetical protein VJ165_05565 [candidate division Zixibacteria bacterium]|nr:hypothetical protein [candidate division Zixibacteria bacterium]
MSVFENFNLRQAPLGFKLLTTAFLLGLSLAQELGMIMAFIQTNVVNTSAEEYFSYLKPTKLVSLSHPHFFGYSVLYFLTGVLFLFTHQPKAIKTLLPGLVVFAALLDIVSWWGIKYVSAKIEIFTIGAGVIFGGGFFYMAIIIFYELWFRKNES